PSRSMKGRYQTMCSLQATAAIRVDGSAADSWLRRPGQTSAALAVGATSRRNMASIQMRIIRPLAVWAGTNRHLACAGREGVDPCNVVFVPDPGKAPRRHQLPAGGDAAGSSSARITVMSAGLRPRMDSLVTTTVAPGVNAS